MYFTVIYILFSWFVVHIVNAEYQLRNRGYHCHHLRHYNHRIRRTSHRHTNVECRHYRPKRGSGVWENLIRDLWQRRTGRLICLLFGVYRPTREFYTHIYIKRCHHYMYRWRTANLYLCSALMAI